jgi:hypothetical protein
MNPSIYQTGLQILTLVAGYLLCIIVGFLAFMILRLIYSGEIDLSQLISEPTGDASMSRFQFLIFTFVIALSLFLVVVSAKDQPHFTEIPATVLTLLGISGSSYLVSKGIQFSNPGGVPGSSDKVTISPAKETVPYGKTLQFKAEVPGNPDAKLKWEVAVGSGTIDNDGLYTAPPKPADLKAGTMAYETIQVKLTDDASNSDLAVITLK